MKKPTGKNAIIKKGKALPQKKASGKKKQSIKKKKTSSPKKSRPKSKVAEPGTIAFHKLIVTAPALDQPHTSDSRFGEFVTELDSKHPLHKYLKQPETVQLLAGIAEYSPYLWQLCSSNPDRLSDILASDPDNYFDTALKTVRAKVLNANDDDQVMSLLREMKQKTHLLIALADIGGVWQHDQIVKAITAMADCAISASASYLLLSLAKTGKLKLKNKKYPEEQAGIVILALGKHGAGELNYSSDTDIIVFFDPESPAIVDGYEAAPMFVQWTRRLVKLLQERTELGYVLRVDLRLRPDPGSTSVAISLPAAFSYYESVGQNWERAAYIKARPIAGDKALGAEFISDLSPFIWRKYFDYAAIADIHAMKRQIHSVKGHGEITILGHDIKLGRGGIREVEFFVQTQQLIFGGRRPELRGNRTLDMLKILAADGWISEIARDEMTCSYIFLRKVEHRLQMVIDEQTQRLPKDKEELGRFARFCGFRNSKEFSQTLLSHMTNVEKHYAHLFEDDQSPQSAPEKLVFSGNTVHEPTIEALADLGFKNPKQVEDIVRGWHLGRRSGTHSARAREVLDGLTPSLLQSFSSSGDPDAALMAFDAALNQMPASVELLTILKSNPEVRDLFSDILGAAPRLANVVTHRPHVLDAVIDPALLTSAHEQQYYRSRAERIDTHTDATESVLDAMRGMALEESFLTSVRLLSNTIDATDAGYQYTELADVMMDLALKHVQFLFDKEYGKVAGGRCAVFGMGKLGSREMTATSDLDLIVLYDFDSDNPNSRGRKSIHANQFYTRLTQRLLSALTVPTRIGPLYEVDMRLRPSGRQGPVATNIDSFREYQLRDAEIWEHMALSRARFVAGDEKLGDAACMIIEEALTSYSDVDRVKSAASDMREMIAEEKGDSDIWDMKTLAGGLLDIEFIAQFNCLTTPAARTSSVDTGTRIILNNLKNSGVLEANQADTLLVAHEFFTSIAQILRLATDDNFNPDTAFPGVLRRVASAVNLPDIKTVEQTIEEYRSEVRVIFDKILSRN